MSLLLILLACTPPIPECSSNADCPTDQACMPDPDNQVPTCQAVECLRNAQCGYQFRCQSGSWTCEPGCDRSEDCLAGEVCTQGECALAACEDTQRDCSVGQDCDPASGQCVDDGRSCELCSAMGNCGEGMECYGGAYCLRECEEQADCPAGYTCVELESVWHKVCYNDCTWLRDNGW